MQQRQSEWRGVLPRLATLALVVAALGLPINNLYVYGLLAVSAFLVFTGRTTDNRKRWLAAAALALFMVGQHILLPVPRIEEGHNAFLIDEPGGALEKGLPPAVFRAMSERFDAAYPPEGRCRSGDFL